MEKIEEKFEDHYGYILRLAIYDSVYADVWFDVHKQIEDQINDHLLLVEVEDLK